MSVSVSDILFVECFRVFGFLAAITAAPKLHTTTAVHATTISSSSSILRKIGRIYRSHTFGRHYVLSKFAVFEILALERFPSLLRVTQKSSKMASFDRSRDFLSVSLWACLVMFITLAENREFFYSHLYLWRFTRRNVTTLFTVGKLEYRCYGEVEKIWVSVQMTRLWQTTERRSDGQKCRSVTPLLYRCAVKVTLQYRL